ncbi:MAG TPA: amidohydrolase family protein [Dehalococcoidia bacterium]
MLIDMHAHVLPDSFPPAGNRESAERWPRWEAADAPNMKTLVMGGPRGFPATEFYYSVEARLRAMEANKVDAELVSPMPTLLNYTYPIQDAIDLCRVTNEFVVRLCETDRRRFYGLGNLPLQDPDAAAKELANVKQMGLFGVEIASNILGVSPGDERFLGFFQEAERQGLCIFVHSLGPTFADRMPPAAMGGFGMAAEIGIAGASLIASGIFEKCPNLRIALSHGAGGLALMLPRANYFWSGTWNEEPPAEGSPMLQRPGRAPLSPTEYARRFYYDSLVFDRRALRFLIDFIGPKQLLIGTDFPAMQREMPAGRTLLSMGLDPAVQEDITWNNCFRYLGIEAPKL